MLLSCAMLNSVGDVNNFEYTTQISFTEGDTTYIYFQLVDISKKPAEKGWKPAGMRYMPAAGSTLSVVLDNIDDDIRITRSATQPFPEDSSIWRVSVLSTDKISGTVNLKLALNQGGVITRGILQAAVSIYLQDGVN